MKADIQQPDDGTISPALGEAGLGGEFETSHSSPATSILTYCVTVFLSSVLLFQIQPMIAKAILPWFGGAASVWTACMLFFQVVLLLGYMYAHWLTRWLSLKGQLLVHMGVIFGSLLALPVIPDPRWRPASDAAPLPSLALLLLTTVGAPYFVLSTTSPLIQAWFARTGKTMLPYRLFAISNVASLIGLLAYPFAVEPLVRSRAQLLGWSAGYVLFAIAIGVAAVKVWLHTPNRESANPAPRSASERISIPLWGHWVALPACGSALLLSVTNYLCQDVAPVPFLWILPLTCYLATFVLCFGSDRWYRPAIFRWALLPAFTAVMWITLSQLRYHMGWMISVLTVALLFGCTFCHGELVRLKPEPRHLTSFYFAMSLGGAIGGIFVTVISPLLFPSYVELFVSIVACAFLASSAAYRGDSNRQVAAFTAIAIVMTVIVFALAGRAGGTAATRVRNFYGALRIGTQTADTKPVRTLYHGSTMHGLQFLTADGFRIPTTYYGVETVVGKILSKPLRAPQRVGVVGLGAGTLAAYSMEGDYFRFYEINPAVRRIALTSFEFLPRCRAPYDVVLGDARLSMERESDQNFDLLALDAFSGDSIPVHLLTVEAFRVYFRHLKPDGVLAVHISNRYLDLAPIVKAALDGDDKQVRVFRSAADTKLGTTKALWELVTANRPILESPEWQQGEIPSRTLRAWTDDYSNIFQILAW